MRSPANIGEGRKQKGSFKRALEIWSGWLVPVDVVAVQPPPLPRRSSLGWIRFTSPDYGNYTLPCLHCCRIPMPTFPEVSQPHLSCNRGDRAVDAVRPRRPNVTSTRNTRLGAPEPFTAEGPAASTVASWREQVWASRVFPIWGARSRPRSRQGREENAYFEPRAPPHRRSSFHPV